MLVGTKVFFVCSLYFILYVSRHFSLFYHVIFVSVMSSVHYVTIEHVESWLRYRMQLARRHLDQHTIKDATAAAA